MSTFLLYLAMSSALATLVVIVGGLWLAVRRRGSV